MRVLHVNKFLYRRGGAEAYVLDVAEAQQARGHEVGLFGMRHTENIPTPLEHTFPVEVDFQAPRSPVDRIRLFGRMVHSPAAQRGIAAAVAEFRPDVVHLHNIYHQLSPSILRPLEQLGIPTLMTVHDYKLVCPTYSFLDGSGRPCTACLSGSFTHAVRRRCGGSLLAATAAATESSLHRRMNSYRHIGRFLAPSQFLRSALVRGGFDQDHVQVLSNFVDVSSVSPRPAPTRTVAFAGRLCHEKGIDTLIEAARDLPADVEVHVAGDGPEAANLRRLAEERAPGRVVFHGRLDRAGVLRLFENAGVVAVPSRVYENQPITLLEAFAAAVPVVASDMGGITELITAGETGALVPPNDPKALAAALTSVLADAETNAAMGTRARSTVIEGFGVDQHLAALDRHYEEVSVIAAQRGAVPSSPIHMSGTA